MATYYVSQSTGSNSDNGTSEALAKLTLAGAQAVASSGDTVIVLDGTFNERNWQKNGVNWTFQSSAGVNYTGGGGDIITDTAGVISTTIRMDAGSLKGSDRLIRCTRATSSIRVLAADMYVTGNAVPAIEHSNGTVIAVSQSRIGGDSYDAIVDSGGTLVVQCESLPHADDGSVSLEGGNNVTIVCDTFDSLDPVGPVTVDITAQEFTTDIHQDDPGSVVILRNGTCADGMVLGPITSGTLYLINVDARLATIDASSTTIYAIGNTQLPASVAATSYFNVAGSTFEDPSDDHNEDIADILKIVQAMGRARP